MTEPYVPSDDEETEAGALGDASDDAMIAAAEAAMKGEGDDKPKADKPKADIEAERDEKGRFLKPPKVVEKPGEKEKPKDSKPSSAIARVLAEREARREEESSYKSKMAEAEALMNKARGVIDHISQREAELSKREREVNEFISNMQRDPMGALKRAGWTAEQFITNAERAKDPNYQEVLSLREELQKRDALISKFEARLNGLEQYREQYENQGKQAQAQEEVRQFWSSIPQDSPVFQDYDDQDDILYYARKVRQQYFDRTGKVASPQQVGEYLHYRALQKRSGVPAETAGQKPKAGQTKAKVPRALGSSEASERRSGGGPKHIHDMSPDEEREYLMDVATNAISGGD